MADGIFTPVSHRFRIARLRFELGSSLPLYGLVADWFYAPVPLQGFFVIPCRISTELYGSFGSCCERSQIRCYSVKLAQDPISTRRFLISISIKCRRRASRPRSPCRLHAGALRASLLRPGRAGQPVLLHLIASTSACHATPSRNESRLRFIRGALNELAAPPAPLDANHFISTSAGYRATRAASGCSELQG